MRKRRGVNGRVENSRYPTRKRYKPKRDGFVTQEDITALEALLTSCDEAGISPDKFGDVMALGIVHYTKQQQ